MRRVVVTGTGIAAAVPDSASVRLLASIEADDVSAALTQVGEVISAVGLSVRAIGVEDRDIKSAGLSVYPRYDKDGQQTNGFQAQHQVSVRVRDLTKVGAVISAGVDAGDDRVTIDSVSLGVADATAARSQAREAAFADARRSAAELARHANAELTSVVTIAEVASGGGVEPRAFKLAADASLPIEAGEEAVVVSLEVTFALA